MSGTVITVNGNGFFQLPTSSSSSSSSSSSPSSLSSNVVIWLGDDLFVTQTAVQPPNKLFFRAPSLPANYNKTRCVKGKKNNTNNNNNNNNNNKQQQQQQQQQ